MSINRFFIKRIFLKRIIFSFIISILFIASSYTVFKACRGMINLYLGYKQYKPLEGRDAFCLQYYYDDIEPDPDVLDKGLPVIFDYVDKNFKYGGYIDGYPSLKDHDGTQDLFKTKDRFNVYEAYVTEEYYKTVGFDLSEGENLYFDFKADGSEEIPILVGANLAKDYPIGSKVDTYRYLDGKNCKATYKVIGTLKSNAYTSWINLYDNKNYYNYYAIVPISNLKMPQKYMWDIMDELILFETNKEEAEKVSNLIKKEIDDKVFFKSIVDIRKYQVGDLFSAVGELGVIVLIITALIVLISIWIFTKFIKLMLRDFTVNIMVGLEYQKLERIFNIYLLILSFLGVLATTLLCALQRYSFWTRKDSILATNGLFGMIGIDYLSLLAALIVNIIIAFVVTKISIKRVKKIPISIGVLG